MLLVCDDSDDRKSCLRWLLLHVRQSVCMQTLDLVA